MTKNNALWKEVVWVSKHQMSSEQKAALEAKYGLVSIRQLDAIVSSEHLLKVSKYCDVIVAVLPVHVIAPVFNQLECQLVLPVSKQVVWGTCLNPDTKLVETRYVPVFDHFEAVSKCLWEVEALIGQEVNVTRKEVLWVARHPMSEEQKAALEAKYGEIAVQQLDKTISSNQLLKESKHCDVIIAVLPVHIIAPVFDRLEAELVIPVSKRVASGRCVNSDTGREERQYVFIHDCFDRFERVVACQWEVEAF